MTGKGESRLAHKHSVYDTDAHFKIDGATRAVKNDSATKTVLVQHDHNSERFTFELPRYVDGHDMSLCNVVQIHYINIDSTKAKSYSGVYEVDDLQVSPDSDDVVICSWLISRNATQFVGNLSFVIRFACISDENDYVWNTAKHTNIFVTEGIYNGEAVAEEYADILDQWSSRLERLENALDDGNIIEDGSFSVTWEDGTVSNYTITFDESGNNVTINDGTNSYTVAWGD
jgi:hypothetical protein